MYISFTNKKYTFGAWLIIAIILMMASQSLALTWPIWPDSLVHLVGNGYGQFNCTADPCVVPIVHPGTDIMAAPGTPVYAIKSGYVKAVPYTAVAIGDSAGTQLCNAWIYAHLAEGSIPVAIGEYVEEGQFIGEVMPWDEEEFHHIHLGKIRLQGDSAVWSNTWNWEPIANPFDEIGVPYDPDPPVFENARENQKFAFAVNYTADYFAPATPLSGSVDIICRIHDYTNDYNYKLIPHQIEYKIEGDSITPWKNAFCFTGPLQEDLDVTVIYQYDSVCQTVGNYYDRDFYFNITNSNGDSVIEYNDKANGWTTQYYHNGPHTIHVRACDSHGNSTIYSMTVTVENYFNLSGTITLEEHGSHGGTVITIASSGQSDTTGPSGNFNIPDIGGGSQPVEIRHGGFAAGDTTIMMSRNRTVELSLPYFFLCGDVNGTGTVNIIDITFLIDYLYNGGPPPEYPEAGDVNKDGAVNILDITYLISYLYQGGPDPDCPAVQ